MTTTRQDTERLRKIACVCARCGARMGFEPCTDTCRIAGQEAGRQLVAEAIRRINAQTTLRCPAPFPQTENQHEAR